MDTVFGLLDMLVRKGQRKKSKKGTGMRRTRGERES